MARGKGSFNLAGAIEPLASAPLDARDKVATKADLTASGSFPYSYVGMETYVVAEEKKYRLVGEDPTNIENWHEIQEGGGSGGTSDYEDLQNQPKINNVTLVGNKTSSDLGLQNKMQFASLPTASIDYLGKTYQYTGATENGLVHNYYYECVSDGEVEPTYSWVQTNIQPSSSGSSTLAGLTDVDLTDIADGQILIWDAETGKFINGNQSASIDELSDIQDVDLNDLADGQTIAWDATNNKWVNVTIPSGGNASLTSAVTSNLAVGAIASGTTLAQGTTFTEFVQKLLITEIAPTIGFTISKSGNVAYGGSYTETLTVNVSNMGTAKKIASIEWYEGSTLKKTDTIDSTTTGSWTYTMDTATTNTTTFKAIVKYVKSNDANDQQTKTASISFYYNKFYGAVSDLNPSEATVEALTSALATGKGGTYSFTTSASRICYAYPKSLGALSSIKDGNGFSLFDSFTRTEQTYTQNGTSVTYYRYVLTDPTTVSSYSVIFA